MSTTLHSFIDIFDTEISDGETSVKLNKIAIPLIQRDYAQGRMDNDVQRVRCRFLDSLYNAITNEPITLDFIYGDIDENGTMTPLDGQQRLTALVAAMYGVKVKDKNFADREIKATYSSSLREYTVKYVSKGTTLQESKGLYGDNILYTGENYVRHQKNQGKSRCRQGRPEGQGSGLRRHR